VRVFGEILSGLVIRASDTEILAALDLAIVRYQTPNAVSSATGDALRHLFGRTVTALSPALLRSRVLQLLELPVAGLQTVKALPSIWPEPFDASGWPTAGDDPASPDLHAALRALIALVASDVIEVRRRATIRVIRAYELGFLSVDDQAAFAAALWCRTDRPNRCLEPCGIGSARPA